jgi:transcription-repair coupling factor (superfamily II helicase)
VKNAIIREIGRSGQVLIIFNRVETIYNFASYVRNLIGENISISVAHGQMSSEELEKEIMKLYSGETQVLVSTTLIENGVNLPNANTLIVINSDILGLSQLYQLKGRIGRSDKKAYAYFTFDSRKMLNETAYKRLQAIKEFSEMGSGFKIAMRDLEIRGAGNLLGLEQSGHIEKIGYNLYVKLLNESVGELKGEKVSKSIDIKIETDLSAYLSHSYVSSMSHRMNLYKQIAEINSDENLSKFISQTEEIYGDMPRELINLCKIAYIKNLYAIQGVNKLVIKDKCKVCFVDREHLKKQIIDVVGEYDFISLNLSENPVIEINMPNKEQHLDFLISFGKIIGKNC